MTLSYHYIQVTNDNQRNKGLVMMMVTVIVKVLICRCSHSLPRLNARSRGQESDRGEIS